MKRARDKDEVKTDKGRRKIPYLQDRRMNYFWERGVINQLQLPLHLPPKKQKKRSFYLISFSFC